jgi:hypothetical protein
MVSVNDRNPWPIVWPSWPVAVSINCAGHEKQNKKRIWMGNDRTVLFPALAGPMTLKIDLKNRHKAVIENSYLRDDPIVLRKFC